MPINEVNNSDSKILKKKSGVYKNLISGVSSSLIRVYQLPWLKLL